MLQGGFFNPDGSATLETLLKGNVDEIDTEIDRPTGEDPPPHADQSTSFTTRRPGNACSFTKASTRIRTLHWAEFVS